MLLPYRTRLIGAACILAVTVMLYMSRGAAEPLIWFMFAFSLTKLRRNVSFVSLSLEDRDE